jgi:hypothetical protein
MVQVPRSSTNIALVTLSCAKKGELLPNRVKSGRLTGCKLKLVRINRSASKPGRQAKRPRPTLPDVQAAVELYPLIGMRLDAVLMGKPASREGRAGGENAVCAKAAAVLVTFNGSSVEHSQLFSLNLN